MFKASISNCVEKEGRHYFFSFDPNAPLGELYDVLFQMQLSVVAQMNQNLAPPQEVSNDEPQVG